MAKMYFPKKALRHFVQFVLVGIFQLQLFAQSFPDRKIFSAAGKELKNANVLAPAAQQNRLTFTLGEPFIGIGVNSSKRLFSGFIQADGITPISNPSPVLMPVMEPFKISPNPTVESVKVEGPENWEADVFIQLIDLQGKLVKQYDMKDRIAQIEFDISLAPGNYFLNFYQLNGTFIQQSKFIKLDKQ